MIPPTLLNFKSWSLRMARALLNFKSWSLRMERALLNFKPWSLRMERALGDQTMESHLLGALLALDLMKGMLSAGTWIFAPDTMMAKVAGMSSYPSVMAYLWMALAIGVIPYFCMQAFGIWSAWRRKVTRLACHAILVSGVLWAFLAYLSKNIDSDHITGIFILHSLTCIAMSAILASSINTAQAREANRAHLSEESQT